MLRLKPLSRSALDQEILQQDLPVAFDLDEEEKTAAKDDLSTTKQKEIDLWNHWKENGEQPDHLRPLLHSLRPVIRGQANFWASRADLPPEAVHAEFTNQAVRALQTYNPDKGAALGSWVRTNLRKAQRWVSQYQDPTRIQENRYYKTGAWDNAVATLDDQLGREPTTRELSEHLGWSEAEAGRMEAEKRKSGFSTGFEGYDQTSIMPSRESEKLRLVRYELGPNELQVFDYTVGANGKPQLRPGEIAKKLSMSPSKVTRIRTAIAKKLNEYE
jgi:DNA-directed RNA polymerase specialized sigma subunit